VDLARVVGRVVCTIKDPSLKGVKLLMVQPLNGQGEPFGKPLVALDAVGSGAGEKVFYVTGREAAFAFLPDIVISDASIVGIVDRVDLLEEPSGSH
jgi:microcompartment protein CcmK/EutM